MYGKEPFIIDLEPGLYHWCACGRTKDRVFCDGSHDGTDKSPVEFTVTERKRTVLCGCGTTKRQPFCDGAHKKL